MTTTLTINPELRDLLPPLSSDKIVGLEADILRDGCTDPLIVWGEVLVDGHHRYAICMKHDVPFKIQQKDFASLIDVKIWMCDRQGNRRNLTLYQRGVVALKMKPVLAEKAKQNQKQSKGHGKKGLSNLTNLNTRYQLSEKFKISAGTLHMVEFLEFHASEEIKQNLHGDRTSINREYKRLKAAIDAKEPVKPKATKTSTSSTTSKTASKEAQSDTKSTQSTPSTTSKSVSKTATAKSQESESTQATFPDTTDTTETENPIERPTVVAPLWKGVKEQQTYSCGVRFEPDPDDDVFDWITREEREEMRKQQEASPALKLVPLIRNYTIQSIPEHDPEYLVSCLFSLFQPLYREKLLYALARKMLAKNEAEAVRKFLATLTDECQS